MKLALPLAFLALLPALAAAQSSQITVSPGDTSAPVDRSKVRIEQKLGDDLPTDVTFQDRTGKAVKFGDLFEGKPAILLPIFYRCTGVCNLELRETLETLKKLKSKTLGKDFNVIVLGIHPKETPDLAEGKFKATVAELKRPGTENGWKFLVGDEASILRITNGLGFYYTYDPARDAIDHPSGIMFLTPQAKISSYIFGAIYTVPQFENGIGLASRRQVGEKAQEIFFGCIHVDPVTGKRSLVFENIVKVGGIVTLIVMGLSFAVLTGRAKFGKRA